MCRDEVAELAERSRAGARPHREHRAARLPQDLRGDAAEQQVGGPAASVGAEDDEVDVVLVGALEDAPRGVDAAVDHLAQAQRPLVALFDELAQLRGGELVELLEQLFGLREMRFGDVEVRFAEDEDVLQHQLRVQKLGGEQGGAQGLGARR